MSTATNPPVEAKPDTAAAALPAAATRPAAPVKRARPTPKPAARPAAKPAAKPAPAARKARVAATAKPASAKAAVLPAQPPAATAKAPRVKEKLVRDSFTMPRQDFALIQTLKDRAMGFRHAVKKSELLRAGLHALAALPTAALQQLLAGLPALKSGRPKKGG